MASELQLMTIYVQNMAGEILTLSCPVDISISDFYHLVYQSLSEPRPLLQNIQLLQNKILLNLSEDSKEVQEDNNEEFVSLTHILNEQTIYLFIEDAKINIRFLHCWPSIVQNDDFSLNYNPNAPVLYEDGTHFEKYTLQIIINDKTIINSDFHALIIEEYDSNFRYYIKYTNICHNNDDIQHVGGLSEYYCGGGSEMTIRFKENVYPYSSPTCIVSQSLLGNYSYLEDIIRDMVHEKWMQHVHKMGDGVLHTYPLK
jgi:hypothetical protein